MDANHYKIREKGNGSDVNDDNGETFDGSDTSDDEQDDKEYHDPNSDAPSGNVSIKQGGNLVSKEDGKSKQESSKRTKSSCEELHHKSKGTVESKHRHSNHDTSKHGANKTDSSLKSSSEIRNESVSSKFISIDQKSSNTSIMKKQRIMIRPVFNLPKTSKDSDNKDVYDPFQPTNDDADNQAYDPFQPTVSDDENEKTADTNSDLNIPEESPFKKMSPPQKKTSFASEVISDIDVDMLLDRQFEAAENLKTKESKNTAKQSFKSEPVKASIEELDMFAEEELEKAQAAAKARSTDAGTMESNKTLNLSSLSNSNVTELENEKSSIAPIRFKKFSRKVKSVFSSDVKSSTKNIVETNDKPLNSATSAEVTVLQISDADESHLILENVKEVEPENEVLNESVSADEFSSKKHIRNRSQSRKSLKSRKRSRSSSQQKLSSYSSSRRRRRSRSSSQDKSPKKRYRSSSRSNHVKDSKLPSSKTHKDKDYYKSSSRKYRHRNRSRTPSQPRKHLKRSRSRSRHRSSQAKQSRKRSRSNSRKPSHSHSKRQSKDRVNQRDKSKEKVSEYKEQFETSKKENKSKKTRSHSYIDDDLVWSSHLPDQSVSVNDNNASDEQFLGSNKPKHKSKKKKAAKSSDEEAYESKESIVKDKKKKHKTREKSSRCEETVDNNKEFDKIIAKPGKKHTKTLSKKDCSESDSGQKSKKKKHSQHSVDEAGLSNSDDSYVESTVKKHKHSKKHKHFKQSPIVDVNEYDEQSFDNIFSDFDRKKKKRKKKKSDKRESIEQPNPENLPSTFYVKERSCTPVVQDDQQFSTINEIQDSTFKSEFFKTISDIESKENSEKSSENISAGPATGRFENDESKHDSVATETVSLDQHLVDTIDTAIDKEVNVDDDNNDGNAKENFSLDSTFDSQDVDDLLEEPYKQVVSENSAKEAFDDQRVTSNAESDNLVQQSSNNVRKDDMRSPSPLSPSLLSPSSSPDESAAGSQNSSMVLSQQEFKETPSYAEKFLEQSRKRWEKSLRNKSPHISSSQTPDGNTTSDTVKTDVDQSDKACDPSLPLSHGDVSSVDVSKNALELGEKIYELSSEDARSAEDIFAECDRFPVESRQQSVSTSKAREHTSFETVMFDTTTSLNKSISDKNLVHPTNTSHDTDIRSLLHDITPKIGSTSEEKAENDSEIVASSPQHPQANTSDKLADDDKAKSSESKFKASEKLPVLIPNEKESNRKRHKASPRRRSRSRSRDKKRRKHRRSTSGSPYKKRLQSSPHRRKRSRSRERKRSRQDRHRSKSPRRRRSHSSDRYIKSNRENSISVKSQLSSKSPKQELLDKFLEETTRYAPLALDLKEKSVDISKAELSPQPISTISGISAAPYNVEDSHTHEDQTHQLTSHTLKSLFNESRSALIQIPTVDVNAAPTAVELDKANTVPDQQKKESKSEVSQPELYSPSCPMSPFSPNANDLPPPPKESDATSSAVGAVSLFSKLLDLKKTSDEQIAQNEDLSRQDGAKEKESDNVLNPTQILNIVGLNPQQQSAAKDAIMSIAELSKQLQLGQILTTEDNLKKSKHRHKRSHKEADGLSPVNIDNIESSAVALYNRDKKKIQQKKKEFQDSVIAAAKTAIKPHYERREVSKTQYKDIMKRAVNKICETDKTMEVNVVKIRRLIRRYVECYQQKNKKSKEKMRLVLDQKVTKHFKQEDSEPEFMDSPPSPESSPFTALYSPNEANKETTPTLLKKEPRKIVTLPDLPLPPPPPPPRPRYMM